jgi:4-hydroxy-tetrahydrodipicolinate synthase
MDKQSVNWSGAIPALVTPFDSNGNIDERGFVENIEICLGNGVGGLVPSGCTGEFWALTATERVRLFRLTVEAARGRVPVIASTGAVTTREVIALSTAAQEAGCDGIMVLPPYFVRPTADDLVAHYRAISDTVKLPLMLYNIPNTGNPLTPELVARLAEIDTVVAIKESSLDYVNLYRTMRLVGDQLHVFCGPATLYGVPSLLMGAPGIIDTIPNYWGAGAVEMFRAATAGDLPRARALQAEALALKDLLNAKGRNQYAAIKALMNILGLPGGQPRLPLRPLTPAQVEELAVDAAALGLPVRSRRAAAE